MEFNEHIFRAYDIRGIYPSELNEELAYKLGRAFGTFVGKGKQVAVGRDVRLSSESLKENLVRGLLESGIDCVYMGVMPSPLLYFAVINYNLDAGVVVSAGHNPPEWNGFKFCGKGASMISMGSGLEKVGEILKKETFASGKGSLREEKGLFEAYERFVREKIGIKKKLGVGVDPGNGTYSGLATRILKDIGADVKAINDSPDGTFPSRAPEPKAENLGVLKELVLGEKLDIGVAFDNDGDRSVFIDDKGRILDPDRRLALMIRALIKENEKVVYEVSCSSLVEDMIKEKKGVPILSPVGRTFIKNNMDSNNAVIGGEVSGHLFFREIYGIDDAFFATLKVMEIISNSGKSLSELADSLYSYKLHTEEIKVDERLKTRLIDYLKEDFSKEYKTMTMDGVKVFSDKGWFLLRASNTGPIIRLRAEAKNEQDLKELVKLAKSRLDFAARSLS